MKFNSYSPETVFIIGAGFTNQYMSATDGQASFITNLIKDEEIDVRINNFFKGEILQLHSETLISLLILLGDLKDDSVYQKEIDDRAKKYAAVYKGDYDTIKKSLSELKNIYNWKCFRDIARQTERDQKRNIKLQTLYTTLDFLVMNKSGFSSGEIYYPPEAIYGAIRCINLLTIIQHYIETAFKFNNKQNVFKEYYDFCYDLAEIIRKESINYAEGCEDFTYRKFTLFSYGMISYNWDPAFLGILFNTHRKVNHNNNIPHLGSNALKLRLFNDFGIPVGGIKFEDKKPQLWFQGHESTAARINESDYPSRLMRVGKFLFPHGSSAFRTCPVCRKTNSIVREINENILIFYGPMILPEFNLTDFYNEGLLTDKEIKSFGNGIFDGIECYQCGHLLRITDAPLIYQSTIKGIKPPLLEEIFHESNALLKNAKHIIFNGYQVPEDDTILRPILLNSASAKNPKKITMINYDSKLKDIKTWFYKNELETLLNDMSIEESTRCFIGDKIDLFNSDSFDVRITFKGFPAILEVGIDNIINFTPEQ